jgi:histidine triad (HIT) family protein
LNLPVISQQPVVGNGAEGSFVAINNRVSQSVPHVHIHVVPRSKGDGLKGFFWPRRKPRDDPEMESARSALREAITRLKARNQKS